MEITPSLQPSQKPSRRKIYLVVGIIAAVVIIGAGILFALMRGGSESLQTTSVQGAEAKLYSALANAAKQQKLRVGMYRETFANASDAENRQNVGTVNSSVAEIDTAASKFRSVQAYNFLQEDKTFSVGRCLDGKTYSDLYSSPARHTERAKTLADASTRLQLMPEGNLYYVDIPAVYIPCPHVGLLPANPFIPVARLSDGLMPVTLSDTQAADWQKKIQSAQLLTVKDEGTQQYNGHTVRKFSFAPKGDELKTSAKLYDIFYETADIAKIKSQQPKAQVDYEFQSINPNNSGGIKGFYYIDADKNLPVYSELFGINPDKKLSDSEGAARNVARTKQTYSYPNQLAIDINTPLEFLR